MHILPSETSFCPERSPCHAQALALPFYALCVFTIVFSLFWMALPKLPLPCRLRNRNARLRARVSVQAAPGRAARDFYLCDEGGRVVVYTCTENGLPDKRLLRTGIYVNLLPEADAIRLKQGFTSRGDRPAAQLEDLGG